MTKTTCPACGVNAFVAEGDGGTCSNCGVATGTSNVCPHCRATARVEGSGRATVCAVCGGPRIGGNFGGEAAANALRAERKALAVARASSIASLFQGVLAIVTTLIALAIFPSTLAGQGLAFAFAIAPLLLALRSRTRAGRARKEAEQESARAWHAAAEDVVRQHSRGITASALAQILRIDPKKADELLTALAVNDRTRIDVGDDAEIRYSVFPETLVRVEDEPSESVRPREEAPAESAQAELSVEREGRMR